MIERDIPQLIRRARGYAPYPIHLGFKSRQILGCGAEYKNTFCLTRDDYAFLSQHIGDMENLETMEHYENTIELYRKLFRIEPEIIAHDLHPDYLATCYAKEIAAKSTNIKLIPVQHHHAHAVSCMVDNGLEKPVIGVILDGTGYGSDGNIWGGEFMIADYGKFTRMGHLEYLPLPGGDLAIKKPFRTAVSYLLLLIGENILNQDLPLLKTVDKLELNIIQQQIERRINSPLTSSCGRLFDAVAALIGIRNEIDYEAQAAIEMEMLAYEYTEENETEYYPFSIIKHGDLSIVKLTDLFSAIIRDLQNGLTKARIAMRFHNTVARMIVDMCHVISEQTGLNQVVLSGGVFQNRLLLRKGIGLLEAGGFKVFTHQQVPTNDGGISLGQTVIANFISE